MKIKHIYLTARNPRKLAEFYERAGLSVRFADGERWIQFNSESAAFCIAGIEESIVKPSTNAVVVFEVEDLEASLEQAIKSGATISGSVRDMGGHGRVAEIHDPEDNAIQIFQSKRAKAP